MLSYERIEHSVHNKTSIEGLLQSSNRQEPEFMDLFETLFPKIAFPGMRKDLNIRNDQAQPTLKDGGAKALLKIMRGKNAAQ